MIQATQTQALNAKALEGATAKSKSAEEVTDLDTALESQDFANELMASLGIGMDVKPVQITTDQMIDLPSELIKNVPQAGNSDVLSPKIFDPALTNGVDDLLWQKNSEVIMPNLNFDQTLQVAGDDLTQSMLKLSDAEVGPQLMSLEDLMAQKGSISKKALNANLYGMKPQQAVGSLGLMANQIVSEKNPAEAGDSFGNQMNSQQFILNMMSEQGQDTKISETQAPMKVLDMSNIKSDNADQLMDKITDYIVQAKAAKEPTVNMRVNHEDLGLIDITVSKNGVLRDAVAISIGTHTAEGRNFFQQGSKDLVAHLTSAGINISDLKVETPSQSAKSDMNMNQQGGQGSGTEKHFGSEQNQRRHESERRQELWNLLSEEAA